jgi:hypothetical protein
MLKVFKGYYFPSLAENGASTAIFPAYDAVRIVLHDVFHGRAMFIIGLDRTKGIYVCETDF